jgi:hypothetical protein
MIEVRAINKQNRWGRHNTTYEKPVFAMEESIATTGMQ